jgi:hypothetical protein
VAFAQKGGGGGAGALGRDAGGLAAVGLEQRLLLRQAGEDQAGDLGAGRQLEIHVGALGHALQQPGLRQELQVPRQARLRLAEDGAEL